MERKNDIKRTAKTSQEFYSLPAVTSLGRSKRIRCETSILEIITPYLTASGTVVEIGSGRGEFAELVSARGYRYIGFEPSSSLRNDLTERGLRRLERVELDELGFEVEKLLRQIRGDRPREDTGADTQQRNRRIQRLNTCGMMLRTHRLRRVPPKGDKQGERAR